MARAPRTDIGGHVYHVLNRANARASIFEKDADFEQFEETLAEARERVGMRVLAYCVMPNHWHLVLHTRKNGNLSSFTGWLTLTHTQRWRASHKSIGQGHLYQGRYKSFICENDAHFIQLVRYVERNALRAGLVNRAERWRWSSVWQRNHGTASEPTLLDKWPVPVPRDYLELLNEPQSESEVEVLRRSVKRGSPYGSDEWTRRTVRACNLESTVRPCGRPAKKGS